MSNNPDPDAIASAVALGRLLRERANLRCRIAYSGIIKRAENKALVRCLGNPLTPLAELGSSDSAPIILVDTQPGAGNISTPAHAQLVAVIDHHPWRAESADVAYVDVRADVGASSTILVEYLRSAGVKPDSLLATALFYGIKTDTRGLSRGASSADVSAYTYLQPAIDMAVIAEIEQVQVPVEYYRDIHAALENARIYDQLIISYLGSIRYPDLTAEIADLLIRIEGCDWVVCMGFYERTLMISVRTQIRQGGAGSLVQSIVGDQGTAGGHGTVAGGQMPLGEDDNLEKVLSECRTRILRHLGLSATQQDGRPLFD